MCAAPPPAYEEFPRDEEIRLFHEGIRYYNEGDFFEAHESWEDVWANLAGDRCRFYQGMIQAAVTLEHILRDNPRGVQRVWPSVLRKFEGLPDVMMGVDIPAFLEGLRPIIEPILTMPTTRGQQPGDVVLPWDPAALPKIELLYDPFETGEA